MLSTCCTHTDTHTHTSTILPLLPFAIEDQWKIGNMAKKSIGLLPVSLAVSLAVADQWLLQFRAFAAQVESFQVKTDCTGRSALSCKQVIVVL